MEGKGQRTPTQSHQSAEQSTRSGVREEPPGGPWFVSERDEPEDPISSTLAALLSMGREPGGEAMVT